MAHRSIELPNDFSQALSETGRAVEEVLDGLLTPQETVERRVLDAMRYGTLSAGKRLRAFLVVASCELFNVSRTGALRVAAAVECVHAYALIHDDLPAMDDSTLRRGQPTVHRAYDSATAILAGDGLLTLAFEIISDPATHSDPLVRANLVQALAKAVGAHGMVGGQQLDLLGEAQTFDIGEITRLQRLKTGELIAFACEAGAIMGKAARSHRSALHHYAHDVGLAFQIADDLLDAEGTADATGKPTGQDDAAGKATFVAILGADRAREQANRLAEQARRHLDVFDTGEAGRDRPGLLRQLATYVVTRAT